MRIDRRRLLGAGALGAAGGLLAGRAALAQTTPAAAAPSNALDRLTAAVSQHRLPLSLDSGAFGGAGWDLLVREGRASQFVLLGEEHGVAEVPQLAGALYEALRPAGYDRVALEISPPMAADLDAVIRRGGVGALSRFFADPANWIAFYTLREEAEFLASVRRLTPGRQPVFWGLDFELGADRRLIAELSASAPAPARPAMARLSAAAGGAWSSFQASRDFRRVFPFSGDPKLVRDVRAAWPRPSARSEMILETLEQTLEINHHQMRQENWESNRRRAEFNRANLVRYWRAEKAAGRSPKVLFKFGAYHMTRGRTGVQVFDIGSLAAEAAALEGSKAFHVLLVPGPGSRHAVFDPAAYAYEPQTAGTLQGLEIEALSAPTGQGHSVVDLRPLRSLAGRNAEKLNPGLVRAIHGFDATVIFDGATPSTPLA